jgi:hypothetical protein
MSNRKAKIISRDAFAKAFIEAEVIMRRNLNARLEVEIEKQTDDSIIAGLKLAQKIVFGEKVEDEPR